MLNILRFEIYKIVRRKLFLFSPIIILGTVVTLLTASLSSASSYDGNGDYVKGYKAIKYEKEYAEKISGELTSEKIAEVIELYNGIYANSNNLTENNVIKESVYISELYPYNKLVSYTAAVYTHTGLQPDYNVIKTLTYEDGLDFYSRRDEQLIGTLNMDYSYGNYSDTEKNAILKFDGEVSKPYVLGYALGWESLIENAFPFLVILTFVVLINVSSVFSNEFQRGTAQVILSAKHGKGIVIGAKLFAAFTVSAVLMILLAAINYAETMIVWGSNGADGQLEIMGNIYPYNITVGQSALLYVICAAAACLLFAAITAMLSALIKTPFNTLVIMAIFLIAPMFLNLPDEAPVWLFCLENLLPTNMMAFWGAIYEYQYEIFGLIIPPYVFLPIFAVLVSCVCVYFAHRAFKRHQIS